MFTNRDGFRKIDKKYIMANVELKCDSEWSEELFHDYDRLIR